MWSWLQQCWHSQISRMLEPKLVSIVEAMPVVSTNNKEVCSSLFLPSSLLLLPPLSRTIKESADMAVWKIWYADSEPQNHRTNYRRVGLEIKENWEITVMKWLGKSGLIVHNYSLESIKSRKIFNFLWLVEFDQYHLRSVACPVLGLCLSDLCYWGFWNCCLPRDSFRHAFPRY